MNFDVLKSILLSRLSTIGDDDKIVLASDFDLNPDANKSIIPPKPSAVLIPLIEREGQTNVILTRRSFQLRAHSGQVAFPGGKYDEDDKCLAQTALREAYEEIGLLPQNIELIAQGGQYLSGTNYLITPIIGFLRQSQKFTPNHNEVEEVFEVPFDFLFNSNNHEIRDYYLEGHKRRFYAISFEKYLIWGVTAGLIANITKLIFAEKQHEN